MQIQIREPLLFIDDDPYRLETLQYLLGPDAEINYASTFDDACLQLQEPDWATVMLDHDLEDPWERDGQQLADYIVELQRQYGYFSKTNFLVHSVNPNGANRIHKILDRPDLDLAAPSVIPFTLFKR